MTELEKDLACADAGWNAGLRGMYPAVAKRLAECVRAQAEEIQRLRTAIQMAITQNECDMLLTGEELRECRKALGDCNG